MLSCYGIPRVPCLDVSQIHTGSIDNGLPPLWRSKKKHSLHSTSLAGSRKIYYIKWMEKKASRPLSSLVARILPVCAFAAASRQAIGKGLLKRYTRQRHSHD